MFRTEITDDRSPARRRPDPVSQETGVFALLEAEELSAVEAERPAMAEAAAEKRARRPQRLWLPQDILKYLTHLYGRFKNPFRK